MKQRLTHSGATPRGVQPAIDYFREERRSREVRFPRKPQSIILFPAPYPTAIANLGFLTIWYRLNAIADFTCDRAFWDSRSRGPTRGLQTDLPLASFPLIFVSSSFELDLAAFIRTLLNAGINPLREQRSKAEPIIVAGGMALTLNPAPWSPFVDLAILGEGEEAVETWTELHLKWLVQGGDKRELLDRSAELPSAWIPSLPERQVKPALYADYGRDPACSATVHSAGHFGDCWLVEVSRGCPRGCLFCAVCGTYLARFAQTEAVFEKIARQNALGAAKIGLVGGAVGDHPDLKEIVRTIVRAGRQITLSSLRLERCDEELLTLLIEGGLGTLTVAPETGSEQLRRSLGKKATNEDLARLVRLAGKFRLRHLRLYFLIGLPEPEEPEEIVTLVKHLRQEAPTSLKIDLSVSSFIPKPGTPWERAPFAPHGLLEDTKRRIRSGLRELAGVVVNFEPTRLEREMAWLSRGDEDLGRALLRAIQGNRSLEQELRTSGMNPESLLAFIPPDKPLPWRFIQFHK